MVRFPSTGAVARPVGFPGCRHCPYLHGGAAEVCLACFEQAVEGLVPAPGPVSRCGACGGPASPRRPCANPLCARADRGWSAVFALGSHEAALRRSIASYKYRGERWWAGVFARLLAGYLRAHPLWFEEYDVVVPMPAYQGRGARRSWDPVGLLFTDLAAIIGSEWDCDDRLVAKVTETPPMSGRSRWERVAVAEGALRPALVVPDRRQVAGRRILVVDDVMTEGSSLREVAAALLTAGAEEVTGLVLARRGWDAPTPTERRITKKTA